MGEFGLIVGVWFDKAKGSVIGMDGVLNWIEAGEIISWIGV